SSVPRRCDAFDGVDVGGVMHEGDLLVRGPRRRHLFDARAAYDVERTSQPHREIKPDRGKGMRRAEVVFREGLVEHDARLPAHAWTLPSHRAALWRPDGMRPSYPFQCDDAADLPRDVVAPPIGGCPPPPP